MDVSGEGAEFKPLILNIWSEMSLKNFIVIDML